MKKILLFVTLFVNLGCEKTDMMSSGLGGKYETNAALDPSCVALPLANMPKVIIAKNGDNSYNITHEKPSFDSVKKVYVMVASEYKNISTSEDARGTVLTYNGKELGYFGIPTSYTGTDNTKRLWIRYEDKTTETYFFFVGEKISN